MMTRKKIPKFSKLKIIAELRYVYASYTWYEVRRCVLDCCNDVDLLIMLPVFGRSPADVHQSHTRTSWHKGQMLGHGCCTAMYQVCSYELGGGHFCSPLFLEETLWSGLTKENNVLGFAIHLLDSVWRNVAP